MTGAILTVNAGSSSLKYALFETDGETLHPAAKGQVEGNGADPDVNALFAWVDGHLGRNRLIAVGHRVVHGGQDFWEPTRVTEPVLGILDRLCPLAPLHQPHNLAAIRAIRTARPALPQVACFDTGFHHGQDAVATRLAIPRALADQGVRRYGFHGLSYEYVAGRLQGLDPDLASGRVIVAHLGNGASLCAIRNGKSVDTTMSFTALDGLVMGTRCGALDPGVILYLLQEHGMDANQIMDMVYRQSGLLGVSGISGDMRVLLASADARAREAIDLFVYQIARQAGAMASSLGGLDGLVFTAGIGEHAPEIRAAVCARLGWLGVALDPVANSAGHGRIDSGAGRIQVWVVPTDEEAMIATHTRSVVARSADGQPGL